MSISVQRRHWTREQYERMVEAGGFGPEDRVELLDGEIWDMSPQGSQHMTAYELVGVALQAAFPQAYVRHQGPFALDDISEPEPDLAVVPGTIRDYVAGHPSTALLLVEVSDSSLRHDRTRKLAAYARNDVPEYWILEVGAECLEVYREPSGSSYRSKDVFTAGDTVTPLHAPDAAIASGDLLP